MKKCENAFPRKRVNPFLFKKKIRIEAEATRVNAVHPIQLAFYSVLQDSNTSFRLKDKAPLKYEKCPLEQWFHFN
jgi:hypothetical protein